MTQVTKIVRTYECEDPCQLATYFSIVLAGDLGYSNTITGEGDDYTVTDMYGRAARFVRKIAATVAVLSLLTLSGCQSTRLSVVASTQIDGVDVSAVLSDR